MGQAGEGLAPCMSSGPQGWMSGWDMSVCGRETEAPSSHSVTPFMPPAPHLEPRAKADLALRFKAPLLCGRQT